DPARHRESSGACDHLERDAIERRVGRDHGERRVLARPGAEYRADPIALEPAVADHLRGVAEAPVLAPCPGHDPTVRVEHVADRVDDGECADGAARSLYGPGPDAAGHRPLDAAHLPDGRPGARADPALFDGAVRRSL